jgi:peptidoglycan/xylan/chitin deacetylase (PgdA/CDA1 family)
MAQESSPRTLKGQARQIVKSVIIRSGGMGLYHRLKHQGVLTVLMFHRVLPEKLIASYRADEEYTISTALLEELLAYVRIHYNIVSLRDVLRSRNREAPLPARPLLITFDDGWNDNAVFAAPILARMHVPWTLFVATGAIEEGQHWWQETLLSALRQGCTSYEELKSAALRVAQSDSLELPDDKALSLLILYGRLPPAEREELIATHCGECGSFDRPHDMASWAVLKALRESGVGIGAHGATHLPLSLVENPRLEIAQSKLALEKSLGPEAAITMSFPHGRYNASVAQWARGEGLKLLFTSEPVLNKCSDGWLESDMLGRISISAADIASAEGKLRPDRLMPWLMLRRPTAM